MAVCLNGHDSASDDFCDVCGMRIGGNPPPPAYPATPATGPLGGVSAPPSTGSWPQGSGPAAVAGEPCPRCGTARSGQFCEACGFNFGTLASRNPSPSPSPNLSPSPSPNYAAASFPPAPLYPSAPQAPPGSQVPPQTPYAPQVPSGPQTMPAPSIERAPPPSSAFLPPPAPVSPPAASSFPYPQTTWTAEVAADRAYFERVQALTGPEGAAVAFPSYYAERRFQLLGNQMRIGRRSVSRGLAPEIDLTGPPADPGISRLHAVLIAAADGSWAVLDPGSANGTLVNGTEIAVGDQVPLHDGDRINLGAWTAITVHRD
jgi:FHA domain